MINFLKKKNSAFTLIELLVVIAIIGILSTLAVVAIQSARSKARDSKRIADVKQMQTALELYFNDNGSYPASITSTIATAGVVYMTSVPSAPTPVDGSCNAGNNVYTYSSDGSTYSISFCLGAQTSGLSAGEKVLTRDGIGEPAPWACGGVLTDSRDGQQYSTMLFGTQCWMAKNLNYDSGCTGATWINGTDVGWCGCYNNNSSNCTIYGKMYQWSAAMAGSTTEGAQGICPEGWHIPTIAEFNTFITYMGSQSQYFCDSTAEYIGKSLAATSGWTEYTEEACVVGNNQSTNNSSGFNILPVGLRTSGTGLFSSFGNEGRFWSSTYSSTNAWGRILSFGGTRFDGGLSAKPSAMSVRCIKN